MFLLSILFVFSELIIAQHLEFTTQHFRLKENVKSITYTKYEITKKDTTVEQQYKSYFFDKRNRLLKSENQLFEEKYDWLNDTICFQGIKHENDKKFYYTKIYIIDGNIDNLYDISKKMTSPKKFKRKYLNESLLYRYIYNDTLLTEEKVYERYSKVSLLNNSTVYKYNNSGELIEMYYQHALETDWQQRVKYKYFSDTTIVNGFYAYYEFSEDAEQSLVQTNYNITKYYKYNDKGQTIKVVSRYEEIENDKITIEKLNTIYTYDKYGNWITKEYFSDKEEHILVERKIEYHQ